MAPTTEPAQQDSDAEEAHLISERHDEEKIQDSDNLFYARRRQRVSLTRSSLITLIVITVLTSTVISGLALHFLHVLDGQQYSGSSSPLPGTTFGSCGDTPSSAREANCTFDMMSFSWLPWQCSEPELTAEFLRVRNWSWWEDVEATRPVPFEEVARGDYAILYITREQHMYHCTYMWKKLHRGLLKGQENIERRGIVDDYIGSYEHTKHCEPMLVGKEDEGDLINKMMVDTAILRKFPHCMWI